MEPFEHFDRSDGPYSLAGIKLVTLSYWYDLRVTLTDDSGNTQQQTLSPAFRIDDASSLDNISIDNNISISNGVISSESGITIYDLQGRTVVKSDQGRIETSGMSGAYIVKSGTTALKVIL